MGAQIAETMVEIFRGLPPGHPLFEQFSFVGADELPEYEAIIRRRARRNGEALQGQRPDAASWPCRSPISSRAIASAFSTRRSRLASCKARRAVRERLEREPDPGVEFYDAGEGLRRGAPQGQPPLRPGQSQRRQRAGAGHGGDHRRRRRARPAAGSRAGRADHQVGPAGRLLDRAAAGQRQPGALPREAAGHPGCRRRPRALRRDAEAPAADAPDPGRRTDAACSWSCRTSARSRASTP